MEDNYFTILWWFLPYINMTQLWVHMCLSILNPLPTFLPTLSVCYARAPALSALLLRQKKKKIQEEKRLYVDLKKIQYTSWEHYLSLKLYCITLPSISSHVWLPVIGLCPILSSFKLATVFIANQHSEFTRALMDLDQWSHFPRFLSHCCVCF